MRNLRLIDHTDQSAGSYEAQTINVYNKYPTLFIIASAVQNNTLKVYDYVFLMKVRENVYVCACVCERKTEREDKDRDKERQRKRIKQQKTVVTRSFIKIFFTWSFSIMPLLKHNNRPPWITFCPELVKKILQAGSIAF